MTVPPRRLEDPLSPSASPPFAGLETPLSPAADAAARLRAFLEAGGTGPPPARGLRRLVPAAAVPRVREVVTDALRPIARRRIDRVRRGGEVRLHIACGRMYKPGWTNIDLAPVKVDIPWNLKRGIPFADGAVDAIVHEHFLEHVPLHVGFAITQACLRALRPGGVLRIGVPDAGACLASYSGLTGDDWARSAATPMVSVLRPFYEHGHAAMYDGQTLVAMCRAAGFAEAQRSKSGGGRWGASADTPERASGTLYVEAVKGS